MTYDCALTTIDNPFDPIEQFDDWFRFDTEKGYYSCSRLARLVKLSDDLTEREVDEAIERAIDEVIKLDFTNTYIKIKRKANENNNTTDLKTEE